MPSLLDVPGLRSTTPEFQWELWRQANERGYDPDAIATVISFESGFKPDAKNPGSTASGLIQFLDKTAKDLGVPGGAAQIRTMSALEQLPLVMRYFERARARNSWRLVDYYLAVWAGRGMGQPDSAALAERGTPTYDLNAGLDRDGDGVITIGDVRARIESRERQAGGRRIEVFPPAVSTVPTPSTGTLVKGRIWMPIGILAVTAWLFARTVRAS